MGRLTVGELCRRHQRVGLDSNVLIYLIESVEPWHWVAGELINAIEAGACKGSLSALALAEVLSGPARAGDLPHVERSDAEIRGMVGVKITTMGPDIAGDAAVIRGVRGMSLADAIHVASARAAGATAFITNDRRIRGSTKLEVVYLDDLEPSVA